MLVEIVSHCYAARHPFYAAALAYQLSSLVLHKPQRCQAVITVCYCPTDKRTSAVLRWFLGMLCLQTVSLPLNQLGRRCIGRNIAAKASLADLVWFADADYCFCGSALDSLADLRWPSAVQLRYPRVIHTQNRKAGKLAATLVVGPQLYAIDPKKFRRERLTRAIGGAQIVRGAYARHFGYLDDERWQPNKRPFSDFCDDVAFRTECQQRGTVLAAEITDVYRLAHSCSAHRRNGVLN